MTPGVGTHKGGAIEKLPVNDPWKWYPFCREGGHWGCLSASWITDAAIRKSERGVHYQIKPKVIIKIIYVFEAF